MDVASQSMTMIQNNSKSSPLDSKRGVLQGYLVRLFRSEDAVTGVAEAREDVAVVVELTVNSCNIDINIRMLLLHQLDSFRSSNQTHQSDVLASLLLDKVNSIAGASTGCEHRVSQDDQSLVDALRELAVIWYRFVGLLISVESDETNSCNRNQVAKSVHHAQSSTQNRDNCHFFSCNFLESGSFQRGFHLNILHRKITGDFVAHQEGNFVEKLSEDV